MENIGKYALTNKCDDIFCSIEGISPEIISFINEKNINYGWRRTYGNSHFFL